MFLDEMTTGLDPAARQEAWRLIEQVRREGATIVLVTHFMNEAERLCDRVAVLVHGQVVDVDTPCGLVARRGGGLSVRFAVPTAGAVSVDALRRLPDVADVAAHDGAVEVRGSGLGGFASVRGQRVAASARIASSRVRQSVTKAGQMSR